MSDDQFKAMPDNGRFTVMDSKPESPESYEFDGDGDGIGLLPGEQTPHTMWDVDAWEEYRASRMMQSTGMVQASEKFQRTGFANEDIVRASDIINSLYERYPEMVPAPLCSDPEFHAFMKEFTESEDYEKLHLRTVHNTAISEIAAAQTMLNYYQLVQTMPPPPSGDGGEQESDEQKEKRQQAAKQAAKQAVKDATQSADEAKGMADALGIGSDDGSGGEMDPDLLQEMYDAYRKNGKLKKILQAAGSYLVVAKSMQRNAHSLEPEEIQDITISGALEHLVPSELAMLCHPDTEDLMIKKILEKQALAFQYASDGEKQAGPVMVFCDESGSMDGPPLIEAKAISLVMAWIAIHQGRWCHLVGYASSNQKKEVTLDPTASAAERSKLAVEWLNHFYSGGTDVDFLKEEAIEEMFVRTGAPRGETDILLITDGYCNYREYVEGFNRWKELNSAKLITIATGGCDAALPEMADHAFTCDDLNAEDDGVKAAFSIGHRDQFEQESSQ